MKEIPLTQNKVVLVDDEDYEWLNQWKWHTRKVKKTYYAARTIHGKDKKENLQMHRVILGLSGGDGKIADHINRNGLDNRRENLRIASKSLNSHNSGIHLNNTSGYRGVIWHKQSKRWFSRIKYQGKTITIGLYADIIEAAESFDRMAVKFYKESASLNFPDKLYKYTNGGKFDGHRILRNSNTSGLRGVVWHKKNNKWIAQIKANRKHIHLGCFDDSKQAALSYDRAAIKYFGDKAVLNFPDKIIQGNSNA